MTVSIPAFFEPGIHSATMPQSTITMPDKVITSNSMIDSQMCNTIDMSGKYELLGDYMKLQGSGYDVLQYTAGGQLIHKSCHKWRFRRSVNFRLQWLLRPGNDLEAKIDLKVNVKYWLRREKKAKLSKKKKKILNTTDPVKGLQTGIYPESIGYG